MDVDNASIYPVIPREIFVVYQGFRVPLFCWVFGAPADVIVALRAFRSRDLSRGNCFFAVVASNNEADKKPRKCDKNNDENYMSGFHQLLQAQPLLADEETVRFYRLLFQSSFVNKYSTLNTKSQGVISLNKLYNISMKITFFEVPKMEQPVFVELFAGAEITIYEEKLTENNLEKVKDADVISVFINSVIDKGIIDALPNLKLITTRSTGFDHIDVAYCETKNIQVANVPAYGSHTVAEFAFALLLNLSRKIFDAGRQLKEEGDFSIFSLQGFDLNGKTLGVLGTGKIGKNAVRIAKGFGMNVLAYDLHPDMAFAAENDFAYKSLEEVLAQSDVLTLHAPYSKENLHLINKENVSKMKKGVYLINTARGELVDTDALIWGLKEGIIAGAGLDVLEGERELKEEIEILASEEKSGRVNDYKTLLEDRVLIEMPNVLITPHIAFYSKEAQMEIIKTTVENIKGFVSGASINLVK